MGAHTRTASQGSRVESADRPRRISRKSSLARSGRDSGLEKDGGATVATVATAALSTDRDGPGPPSTNAALLSVMMEQSIALTAAVAQTDDAAEAARLQMLSDATKAAYRRVNKLETTPWGARKIANANMVELLTQRRNNIVVRAPQPKLLSPHFDRRTAQSTRDALSADKVKSAAADPPSFNAKALLRAERE